MKPANMEMNLFLKLALRSIDHQLDLCDAPESFIDITPNSSILPNANVSAEEQISQSDCSDIEISSDEDDDWNATIFFNFLMRMTESVLTIL